MSLTHSIFYIYAVFALKYCNIIRFIIFQVVNLYAVFPRKFYKHFLLFYYKNYMPVASTTTKVHNIKHNIWRVCT
jgi:hypothetical protein